MQQQEAQEECIHSQHTPLSTLPAHSFEHMSFQHASLENMTEESLHERSRFYKELSETHDRFHKARAAWSPQMQAEIAHYLPGEEVFRSIAEADRVLDGRLSIREAARQRDAAHRERMHQADRGVSMAASGVISIRYAKQTLMDMNWYHKHEY